MNDRRNAFEELARRYKQQTGIEVEFKLFFPPDIYAQKVIAAARAGRLPDIFGILGEKKTVASFIKAGHIYNLSPFMFENNKQWFNKFYPSTISTASFSPDNSYGVEEGVYGVPIDTVVMQFVYNKKLLASAGFKHPPRTFEEFLQFAKEIQSKTGKYGFVCGWGEGWLLNSLAVEWAINIMGEKDFLSTIQGDIPYTDKRWIEVFSLFKKIRNAGILYPNITTMINKEAEDVFSKSDAAFSYNGTWAVNVYSGLNPELDYGFFPLPRLKSNFPLKLWGGAGSVFYVNAHSPYKKEAVDFLRWLTAKEQQDFLVEKTKNIPAISESKKVLPAVLTSVIDELTHLTHPNIWQKNEDSRVLEVMNKGLQQIVMGIKEPEELAKEIENEKKRVFSTLKKQ